MNRKIMLLCILGGFMVATAHAGLINLNDFFADPTVTVAVDGSSAVIEEDAFISPVLLANDPGLGDPEVIIPGLAVSLAFDFSFDEPVGNDDEFGAFIVDENGNSAGPAFEFFTQDTSSGTVLFNDLSSLAGQATLGLQFQLTSDVNFDFVDLQTSKVTVSNVKVDVIPEPGTVLLFAAGLIGIAFVGLLRSRRASASHQS